MTLQEAIEEVKDEYDLCCCSVMDAGDIEDGPLTVHLPAIATILNAVVKGELRTQPAIIESMCEEGFASVPFTITPPKPEIHNGKTNHAYKATCHETGNVYYGVTDDSGYAELKLSSGNSVKGELKE